MTKTLWQVGIAIAKVLNGELAKIFDIILDMETYLIDLKRAPSLEMEPELEKEYKQIVASIKDKYNGMASEQKAFLTFIKKYAYGW